MGNPKRQPIDDLQAGTVYNQVMREPTPDFDIQEMYSRFNTPVTTLDCGEKCAPYNPNGIPFCCDICQAVPVAYRQEWAYLEQNTTIWHLWRGDECKQQPTSNDIDDVPDHLLLLACKGPRQCQREFRSSGCRQFPFFPYITADERFIGLAYEWEFENSCWVISHLDLVTDTYRREFMAHFDRLFSLWETEFESYYCKSEEMRIAFIQQKRRIPILHRCGGYHLLSPASDRLQRIQPKALPRFSPYRG